MVHLPESELFDLILIKSSKSTNESLSLVGSSCSDRPPIMRCQQHVEIFAGRGQRQVTAVNDTDFPGGVGQDVVGCKGTVYQLSLCLPPETPKVLFHPLPSPPGRPRYTEQQGMGGLNACTIAVIAVKKHP